MVLQGFRREPFSWREVRDGERKWEREMKRKGEIDRYGKRVCTF